MQMAGTGTDPADIIYSICKSFNYVCHLLPHKHISVAILHNMWGTIDVSFKVTNRDISVTLSEGWEFHMEFLPSKIQSNIVSDLWHGNCATG